MQYRQRSSRYDRRPPPRSGYRNFGRRDRNGFGRQPYRWPNPPRRDLAKEEVFKKAGKLAAQYLVRNGWLPPSALRRRRERAGKRFDGDGGFRRWDSKGYDHRRFDDGGDDYEERRRRRRGGEEGENEGDSGRGEVRWTGRRPWGCYDDLENGDVEGEGDYRRRRFREGQGSWRARSRDGDDEHYRWRARRLRGRREFRGEEGFDSGLKKMEDGDDDTSSYESGEVRDDDDDDDDLAWYAGNDGEWRDGDELLELSRAEEVRMDSGGGFSSNSKEDGPATRFTIELNNAGSEGSLESYRDAEMEITKKIQGKSQGSLDMDVNDNVEVKGVVSEKLDGTESCWMSKDDGDNILKLCCFTDVPTKPRTLLAGQAITKLDELFLEEENVVGEIAVEVPKANVEGHIAEGLSADLPKDQADTSRDNESGVSCGISEKLVEEPVDQHEVIKSSELLIIANKEAQSVEQTLEEPEIKRFLVDKELVRGHVADQVKPVCGDSSLQFNPEFNIKIEVEEQRKSTFYKVCDLNLMADEVEDELVSDHLNTGMPVSEASRDFLVGFGRSMVNIPNKTNVQCLFSGGKMIPVIDLEDDSLTESSNYDSLNSKNNTWYSSMAHLAENGDLHGADRGCSDANFRVSSSCYHGLSTATFRTSGRNVVPGAEIRQGWEPSDLAA